MHGIECHMRAIKQSRWLSIHRIIFFVARLDNFTVTAGANLQKDGKDSMRGHRKKVYQASFQGQLSKNI